MAEETAEEAAQRVNANRLAAKRESNKRKRAEESQEQRENRLALGLSSSPTWLCVEGWGR